MSDEMQTFTETAEQPETDDPKRLQNFVERCKKLADEIAKEQQTLTTMKNECKEQQKRVEALLEDLRRLASKGPDQQREIDFADQPEPDWMAFPIARLELSEKLLEKLAGNFLTVGDVVDWIGTDFREKIPGIGESALEKIREAVDKVAGISIETIREAARIPEPDTLPFENSSSVERDEKEVAEFLLRIDEMLDSGMYLEMEETLQGIRDWVSDNDCYTTKQLIAIDNIASFEPVENWR